MRTFIRKYCLLFVSLTILGSFSCNKKAVSTSETVKEEAKEILWLSFPNMVSAQKSKPKKVFIDFYTDWCGWCKKMDASTFKHPVIVKYINKNFYAVKFNAETKDTIKHNGHTYINGSNPRATHPLAASLMNNKPSYPTSVYLDEELNLLGPVAGYMDAKMFEAVLHFYVEEAYKTTPWNTYYENFQGEIQ